MTQPTSSAEEIAIAIASASPPAAEAASDHSSLRARTYAVCALCIATASVFFMTGVSPLPVLLYFPLKRRFGFEPQLTELSMDFYGRSLLALLAGLAAALSTYAVLRLLPAKAEDPKKTRLPLLPLLTGYAATALLLAMTLYGYLLATRFPTPLPLPKAASSQAAGQLESGAE